MTPGIEVLDRVTSTVDYLRVTVGDGSGATDWLPCDRLVSFMGPLPDRHPEIRDRAGAFFTQAGDRDERGASA